METRRGPLAGVLLLVARVELLSHTHWHEPTGTGTVSGWQVIKGLGLGTELPVPTSESTFGLTLYDPV